MPVPRGLRRYDVARYESTLCVKTASLQRMRNKQNTYEMKKKY